MTRSMLVTIGCLGAAACAKATPPPPSAEASPACVAGRSETAAAWELFGSRIAQMQQTDVTNGSGARATLADDAVEPIPAGAPPDLAAATQARVVAAQATLTADALTADAARASATATAAAVKAWRGTADAMDAQHAALDAATLYADAAVGAVSARIAYLKTELALHAVVVRLHPANSSELAPIDHQLAALIQQDLDGEALLDKRLREELAARAQSAVDAVEICTQR